MGVLITRGMFGKDDGQIQWYGVIATTNLSRESRDGGDGVTLAPAWRGTGEGAAHAGAAGRDV